MGHHGSKTSSQEKFIQAVNPKIALIGVGKNNKFGHPNDEVIDRLESLGTRIYRTDLNGEISITVTPKRKDYCWKIYRHFMNLRLKIVANL